VPILHRGTHCLIDKTDWIKTYDGGFVDQPNCGGRRPADASGKARKRSLTEVKKLSQTVDIPAIGDSI